MWAPPHGAGGAVISTPAGCSRQFILAVTQHLCIVTTGINSHVGSNGITELVHLMSGTIQRSPKNTQKFTAALIMKSGERQLSLE